MSIVSLPHTRRGSGAPLVVFPGLSGRHGVAPGLIRWIQRQEIAGLAMQREVWNIDRRRGLEAGISMELLASEYAAVLRSHFSAPVDLVGVSTGGSIALQLVADYPELVDRLVLVSAAHRLSDYGRSTQRRIAELLRAGQPRRAAALFLSTTGSTRVSSVLLSILGLLAPRVVVGHNDFDLLATLDAEDVFDLSPRLAEITTPTLVTGGERDRFYTAELFRTISEYLPNATLKVYARAGHIGPAGNRALARLILDFLHR